MRSCTAIKGGSTRWRMYGNHRRRRRRIGPSCSVQLHWPLRGTSCTLRRRRLHFRPCRSFRKRHSRCCMRGRSCLRRTPHCRASSPGTDACRCRNDSGCSRDRCSCPRSRSVRSGSQCGNTRCRKVRNLTSRKIRTPRWCSAPSHWPARRRMPHTKGRRCSLCRRRTALRRDGSWCCKPHRTGRSRRLRCRWAGRGTRGCTRHSARRPSTNRRTSPRRP